MGFLRDLRYAFRSLRQSPGFALTAIAVLALGIGANTAIFTVVYAVILKPLPYPDPARLVFVWQRFPGMPAPFNERMFVAQQNYREWQRQNSVFQEMAAFHTMSLDETGGSGGKVSTSFVTAGLFHLLGARPHLGRTFQHDEERAGHNQVAVLTDSYFEKRFHGASSALSQSVTLDGKVYTVIGVLPPGFYMPRTFFDDGTPDVLVPLPEATSGSDEHQQLEVVARLRRGVSLSQARAEMLVIAKRLVTENEEFYKLGSTSIFPFTVEAADPKLNGALYLLLAAVGFLLLITCANLANLTLARATLRSREILVRLALGAGRGRVLAQLLSESLLVALAGAACGVLLAYGSIRLLLALKPPDLERPELIGISLPVLAFTAVTAVLTAVLFGLGPALVVVRADLASRLRSGGGRGASASRLRGRQFLIASEVALALMLLAGTGLMIRSLQQIAAVGVGFDTSHLTALDLNLPEKRYPDAAVRAGLVRQLIARVQALPGVADAAVTNALPFHTVGVQNFHIVGRPEKSRDESPMADVAMVSPGLLQTMGLRLEAGRWLAPSDLTSDGKNKGAGMVNRAFRDKYFPGQDVLGRRLTSGDEKENFEIVGVVSDYRPMGTENGTRAEIFRPSLNFTGGTMVVRSHAAPQAVAQSLLGAVRSVAPDIADGKVKTLTEYADYWTSQREFNTRLLEVFAGLALVLAMIGIYGVLSNLVTSGAREIGIRMAVGATPAAIGRLVAMQAMVPMAAGLAAGLAGCMALGRLMQSLLFRVGAGDPLTLSAAVTAVLLIAPISLYLPLRRALAVDCAETLRQD